MDDNTTQSTAQIQKPKRESSFFMEIVKFTILAIIVVVPFRLFIAQPFVVSGASMDPAFETGEYLIVDQVSYKFDEPERKAVIIFKYPRDPSKYFIKRIIGLPGETVEIHGTTVTIKNSEYPDGFNLEEKYIAPKNKKQENIVATLKSGEYFVMGDNRLGSSDSRMWGPISEDSIIGRPFVRLLPLSRFDVFPGKEDLSETK